MKNVTVACTIGLTSWSCMSNPLASRLFAGIVAMGQWLKDRRWQEAPEDSLVQMLLRVLPFCR
jgi:hypothetical protein